MRNFTIVCTCVITLIVNSRQIRNWERAHVSIACWILIDDATEDHVRKIGAVKNGWGTACDHIDFIYRGTPGIISDWLDGHAHLAGKSFRGWEFAHKKYVIGKRESHKPVDFILKADIDTYIIGHNLQEYLSTFNPEIAQYIGKQLVSGDLAIVAGAAIILSRTASMLFMEAAGRNQGSCSKEVFSSCAAEDVAMGLCMKELDIAPQDTTDSLGRERFMVLDPATMTNTSTSLPGWYLQMSQNQELGVECCSEDAVAFHKVKLEYHKDCILVYEDTGWVWRNRTLNYGGFNTNC